MQVFDKQKLHCMFTHDRVYNGNIFLEHHLEYIVWLITFTRCTNKIISNFESMRLVSQSITNINLTFIDFKSKNLGLAKENWIENIDYKSSLAFDSNLIILNAHNILTNLKLD